MSLTTLITGIAFYSLTYHCQALPNIIFLVVDDLPYTAAWNAFGLAPEGTSLNNKNVRYFNIPTPKINSIMKESIVIPRTYSAGTTCAPARYALLTGRQPVRSEWAQKITVDSANFIETEGTMVNVQLSKLNAPTASDGDDAYNLAAILQDQFSYKTGMIGKWHLSPSSYQNLGCDALDDTVDAVLYDLCQDGPKQRGFRTVDAFYFENILENDFFSHNPEWMVSRAKDFVNTAINNNEHFFLYLSFTLDHCPPNAYTALSDNEGYLDTPKGTLSEITPASGMKPRSVILQTVDNLINSLNGLTEKDKHNIAATVWLDDAIGAVVSHLQNKGVYDDTFFVIIGDHGVQAKNTLYEQGTRALQVIRYPPYWSSLSANTPMYTAPNDFITSNVDLSAVVYELVGGATIPSTYPIDGTSWVNDLNDRIAGTATTSPCCESRMSDNYQSHAIMTEDLTYIYRAGDTITSTAQVQTWYPNINDGEQLYDLTSDPNEQTNIISDAAYAEDVESFRTTMSYYMNDAACPNGNNNCVTPSPSLDSKQLLYSVHYLKNNVNQSNNLFLLFCFVLFVSVMVFIYHKYRGMEVKRVSIDDESIGNECIALLHNDREQTMKYGC